MKTIQELRRAFLSFYEGKDHRVMSSGSLIPHDDPTAMFVNSGMMPFKDYFLGKATPPHSRLTSAQKCVRAGGKHNDLDNVGYTARHHTFFEMLGNFSFGDYFKQEAIAYGWELVTKVLELPEDKLCVTIYHTDEEAYKVWRAQGLSDQQIIRIATDDNFWSMGDTGPCGPSTEIFYDHGDHIWGGPPGSAEEDGDRFIEIYNIVFMQYNRLKDGTMVDLPNPCVDTGMGLERVGAILQGKHNNYDIDVFQTLINKMVALTGKKPEGDALDSMRVIADHLRSCAFLMADGLMPDTEGRGYVLRRIMRRAMRHAHLLGAQEPLMHQLIPSLLEAMAADYPELSQAEASITKTLEREETKFGETLSRGLSLLDTETKNMAAGDVLNGEIAFKLYDSYGFPLDLTQDVLRGREMTVDVDGFETEMEAQRARGRAAWQGGDDTTTEKLWYELVERTGATQFLGYDKLESGATVHALVANGVEVEALQSGQSGYVVVDHTPFYAESGGQVGDTGVVKMANGDVLASVKNTTKQAGNLWVHHVTVADGQSLGREMDVVLDVDVNRRKKIMANHSVTHLLHEALRRHLGDHVAQKGSQQDNQHTRFDIAHPEQITKAQLRAVEAEVNEMIRQNSVVETQEMPIDEARAMGARALFGEKYGDVVRVVTMGTDMDNDEQTYSIELCGGTHVTRTGEIGAFAITMEGSVSSGVRRVEGLTGEAALAYLRAQDDRLHQVADLLKTPVDDTASRVTALLTERKELQKEIDTLRKQVALGGAASGANDDTEMVNGISFVGKILEGIPPRDLKGMVDQLKQKLGSGVVTLIAVNDDKASVVVGVTDDLTVSVSAVDLVREAAAALGGKGGGGRPDMAQAGGSDPSKAQDALQSVRAKL